VIAGGCGNVVVVLKNRKWVKGGRGRLEDGLGKFDGGESGGRDQERKVGAEDRWWNGRLRIE
jgi:hypothetical protein